MKIGLKVSFIVSIVVMSGISMFLCNDGWAVTRKSSYAFLSVEDDDSH